MSYLDDLARGRGAEARQARRTIRRRARAAANGSSAADDFAPLVGAFDDLASRIDPAARRQLGRDVAKDLRAANAARIRANEQPDGDPMVPRKRRGSGRLRSKRLRDEVGATRGPKKRTRQDRMFIRAAAPKYLRQESSQGDAQVGFVGAMARIMAVHHYGESDTVTRDPSSPRVDYPARRVLGMTPDDRARILGRLAGHLAP